MVYPKTDALVLEVSCEATCKVYHIDLAEAQKAGPGNLEECRWKHLETNVLSLLANPELSQIDLYESFEEDFVARLTG